MLTYLTKADICRICDYVPNETTSIMITCKRMISIVPRWFHMKLFIRRVSKQCYGYRYHIRGLRFQYEKHNNNYPDGNNHIIECNKCFINPSYSHNSCNCLQIITKYDLIYNQWKNLYKWLKKNVGWPPPPTINKDLLDWDKLYSSPKNVIGAGNWRNW